MPTFADCVRLESEKPKNSIRFFASGEFFRAFNQSAWFFTSLFENYVVKRKYVKQVGEDVYFIGFPKKKILDFLDGRPYTKTEWGYDLTVAEDDLPQDESGYEEWKQKADASTGGRDADPLFGMDEQAVMRHVCRELREWPVESKTMLETLAFVSRLREQLAKRTGKTETNETDGLVF